jgi:hypothetical protein
MPIHNLLRTAPGRLLMASAALCALQAAASEKRALTIGATVVAASQCRVDAVAAPHCSGAAPAPRVFTASASPGLQPSFDGHLVMRMSVAGASLDSRKALSPSPERVVLTITP